jgi:hypothetical protein
MRPATTLALVALLLMLVVAAVLQLVFKVGGAPTDTTTPAVKSVVDTTRATAQVTTTVG